MASVPSFDSLSEDIQREICASLACTPDLSVIHRCHLVSKTFNRLLEEPYVLSRVQLPLFPLNWNPQMYEQEDSPWNKRNPQGYELVPRNWNPVYEQYRNFVQKCCDAGNPDAICRVGLLQYFMDQQQDEGLQLLAQAMEKGHKHATQIYGLIHICLGGEMKRKGYEILSRFSVPLIPKKVLKLEARYDAQRSQIFWCSGKAQLLHLKRSYVRDNCTCNGLTSEYFDRRVWDRFRRFEGMKTSMACAVCLWHEVLQILFDFYDG